MVLPTKWATEKVPVPCGKCPDCKFRRVNEWVFRLMEEDKVSSSSHFVTLTYDTTSVPISANGFMTLCKKDVQDYMKRLRKLCPLSKLKYYFAGEYGSQNGRPHYHAIIFNCPDTALFFAAWHLNGTPLGGIHVGSVSGDSIAYTMKYIDKDNFSRKHSRDDRLPEFSLMSKGLGSAYLTGAALKYHRSHLDQVYVSKLGGHKVAMPRYYRQRIWSDQERSFQASIIAMNVASQEAFDRLHWDAGIDYDAAQDSKKIHRFHSFYSSHSQNRKL